MYFKRKPLYWVGDSLEVLSGFSRRVRRHLGHALDYAQRGERHPAARPLKGFGHAGVLEAIANDAAGTYRVVYAVHMAGAVWVLHCFQKKSHRGREVARQDVDLIEARLKVAHALFRETHNGKTHHEH